jgi:hypothetical protein
VGDGFQRTIVASMSRERLRSGNWILQGDSGETF